MINHNPVCWRGLAFTMLHCIGYSVETIIFPASAILLRASDPEVNILPNVWQSCNEKSCLFWEVGNACCPVIYSTVLCFPFFSLDCGLHLSTAVLILCTALPNSSFLVALCFSGEVRGRAFHASPQAWSVEHGQLREKHERKSVFHHPQGEILKSDEGSTTRGGPGKEGGVGGFSSIQFFSIQFDTQYSIFTPMGLSR